MIQCCGYFCGLQSVARWWNELLFLTVGFYPKAQIGLWAYVINDHRTLSPVRKCSRYRLGLLRFGRSCICRVVIPYNSSNKIPEKRSTFLIHLRWAIEMCPYKRTVCDALLVNVYDCEWPLKLLSILGWPARSVFWCSSLATYNEDWSTTQRSVSVLNKYHSRRFICECELLCVKKIRGWNWIL